MYPQPGTNQNQRRANSVSHSHQYKYSKHQIQELGRKIFIQCDTDRNGTLDILEGRNAINQFCYKVNEPYPSQTYYEMLFAHFDYDRSGSLDYHEFQMLLEQMAKIKTYDRQELNRQRRERQRRIEKYKSGCDIF